MCACDSSRHGPGTRIAFCIQYRHLRCQSCVCPCVAVKHLRERGLRSGSRRLRKMNCRASRHTDFDRCRYFDIWSDAFCLFSTSDQTYCRRSRHGVRPNCADGLSSASTHDSTSDGVPDIFSKRSPSSLHLMKHIHGRAARSSVAGGHVCKQP